MAGFRKNVRRVGRLIKVIGRLGTALGLGQKGFVAPSAPVPVARGARFETRRFTNNVGSRGYKLYVPSSYHGQPMPLLVMLHGCTQTGDDFALGTQMNQGAEAQGFLVAYPVQEKSANAQLCWNWFNAGDQQRDVGEPSLIAGITLEIMAEFAVSPRHVYIAGLSAGGATAAIMGAAYPDLYAAVGVHSGLASGAARGLAAAMLAMRNGVSAKALKSPSGRHPPTIVFHGDRDKVVNPVNGDQVIAQAMNGAALAPAKIQGETPGGHGYTRTLHRDQAGKVVLEQWQIHGLGHAWSGGSPAGSYTDPHGPDASREFIRFFLEHA